MSWENEFTESVGRMEPGPGLRARVQALYREGAPRRRVKPVLKYAACFALVLAVLAGGALFQPMEPVQKTGGVSGAFRAPAAGFAVVVNAAEADGSRQEKLEPGHVFRLVDDSPANGMQTMGASHAANSGKTDWVGFFGFQLKCVGSGVANVTYTTNRGELQSLVKMNAVQELYYSAHRTLAGSQWEEELTPAGGNLAYRKVGASQTLAPDSDGMLYLRLAMSTDFVPTEDFDSGLKFTTENEKKMLEGTEIKIAVSFRDGTKSTKTVRLSYPGGERTGAERVAVTIAEP